MFVHKITTPSCLARNSVHMHLLTYMHRCPAWHQNMYMGRQAHTLPQAGAPSLITHHEQQLLYCHHFADKQWQCIWCTFVIINDSQHHTMQRTYYDYHYHYWSYILISTIGYFLLCAPSISEHTKVWNSICTYQCPHCTKWIFLLVKLFAYPSIFLAHISQWALCVVDLKNIVLQLWTY